MRVLLWPLAFVVAALLTPIAANAIPIHFTFVNERGEVINLEPVYPGCSVGRTSVENGKTLEVTCETAVGHQTGIQVRVPGGAGVICYPYVAVIDQYRADASQVGSVSCAMSTIRRDSYKLYFARAAFLTIELKNERAEPVVAYMSNYNCKPNGQRRVGAGETATYSCFREDMAAGDGITIQTRLPNNTADMVCQGWWHNNKTLVFHGNCSINHAGGDKYVFTIH